MRTRPFQPAVQLRPRNSKSIPKLTRWQRLLRFLSTPLGIWTLTTLFVTFGSAVYKHYDSHKKDERANWTRIDQLDQEITHRLYLFDPWNYHSSTLLRLRPDDEVITTDPAFPSNALALVTTRPSAENELHPQFRERNLLSLLTELEGLLAAPEPSCVRGAIADLKRLRIQWRSRMPRTLADYRALDRALEDIRDARWSPHSMLALMDYRIAVLYRRSIKEQLKAFDAYGCGHSRKEDRRLGKLSSRL